MSSRPAQMNGPEILPAFRYRVLVLASTYPRWRGDHEPGFVHELNRRLADSYDVHVICPHAAGAASCEVLDGVTVHRFRYAPQMMETLVQNGGILVNLQRSAWKWGLVPLFLLGLLFACFKAIHNIKPHCVHAHWIVPQGLALAVLGLLSWRMPPFLLTSHGGDLFGLRGRQFGVLKRWVLGKARAVTVVSKSMLAEMAKLGTNADRVSVIPMGVDFAERFSLDPGTQREAARILFVGRLVEKKGVKYLIQALPEIRQRVPNAHLVVVGGGPDREMLCQLSSAMGLQDCIQFVGAIEQSELPDFYRRASLFVAPFVEAASGDREGLGLVTAEAIACGCPVVVGDVPAVADIFLDGAQEMRAVPGDIESLVEKVVASLLAPEAASQRVLALRHRLAAELGWDAIALRYAGLLREIVGAASSVR